MNEHSLFHPIWEGARIRASSIALFFFFFVFTRIVTRWNVYWKRKRTHRSYLLTQSVVRSFVGRARRLRSGHVRSSRPGRCSTREVQIERRKRINSICELRWLLLSLDWLGWWWPTRLRLDERARHLSMDYWSITPHCSLGITLILSLDTSLEFRSDATNLP